MGLGEKIYKLRVEKKLKQEDVACDLEISQSTYSDWENDISYPKRENLYKLAKYYNIEISELLEELLNIKIENKENAIALVNSPNTNINSTEAIIKISESLERLTMIIEKYLMKE